MSVRKALLVLLNLLAGLVFFLTRDRPSVQCRDESGNAVPWWILLKLPQEERSRASRARRQGYRYVYADPSHSLSISPFSLKSASVGAMAHTLTQLYSSGYAARPARCRGTSLMRECILISLTTAR